LEQGKTEPSDVERLVLACFRGRPLSITSQIIKNTHRDNIITQKKKNERVLPERKKTEKPYGMMCERVRERERERERGGGGGGGWK
jgi:hypothetical protein